MIALRALAVLLIAAPLALAGCASPADSESTPTPTETDDPNWAVCDEFGEATTTMEDALDGGQWDDLHDTFYVLSERAQGDVKARLDLLVDNWPEAVQIVVYHDFEDFNDRLGEVAAACADAGRYVFANTFTED